MPGSLGVGSRRHGTQDRWRDGADQSPGRGEAIDEEPARLAELVELGVSVRRRVDTEIAAVSMTHGHSPAGQGA